MSGKKTTTLLFILFLVLGSSVSAHNIFVEVPMQVDPGEDLTFKSFFSHPYDPIEERDMDSMKMKARLPDGREEKVNMKQQATYYETQWRFAEEGEHVFILEREPYQHYFTEIRDFGKSIVLVGDSRPEHKQLGLPLEIVPVSTAEELTESENLAFIIMLGGEMLSDTELMVHQSFEPEGRLYDYDHDKKGIEPDKDGIFTLNLQRDYNYILEADHEIPASRAEDIFDYNTSFFTRNIRFRSTLYLPAK